MKTALVRSFLFAPLAALALACSAAPIEEPALQGSGSDDVVVSIDDQGAETKLFNNGGTTGGSAKCYSLSCPGTKQDDCYVPCVKSGGKLAACATNCGCTLTQRSCTGSVYIP